MGASSGTDALRGIMELGEGLLGSKTGGSGTSSTTGTTTSSERLVLDQAAILKTIQDILGGAEGLASIFAGEQTAGIFNSSVANQAAGDLASKIVGELAKLTAERVTTAESSQEQTTKTKGEKKGLLDEVGDAVSDVFGGLF